MLNLYEHKRQTFNERFATTEKSLIFSRKNHIKTHGQQAEKKSCDKINTEFKIDFVFLIKSKYI